MSIANYAPELFEVWKHGCEKPIHLEFDSEAKAIRFRFRMYMLRKEMRKVDHEALPFAEKCQIKIRGSTAIVCPVDDNFADVLQRAGINIEGNIEPKESPELPENPEDVEAMDAAIKNYMKGNDKPTD